ncbi:MAG TPA: hypothetical protein VG722_07020 [Tepidisphaeraceae bacterium]|nr:hypothetical protein [Tepidisphaeraceae bacterium]
MHSVRSASIFLCILSITIGIRSVAAQSIEPLTIEGPNFVDTTGKPVRFWGQNLPAFYPDHSTADALAKNLAALQINLVHYQLFHLGADATSQTKDQSLLTYDRDSRHFDSSALDRFDYLNSALRDRDIYLALSITEPRRYLSGDVDIMTTNDQDRRHWVEAMQNLNARPWKDSSDVYSALPVIDERIARLNEEFARKLLMHVNAYTHQSYAVDPQVLILNVTDGPSLGYEILRGKKLPAYWQKELLKQWTDYATAHAVIPGDLYKPTTPDQIAARAAFLDYLNENYFKRIKKAVRSTGCEALMTFSNVRDGQGTLHLESQIGDYIEDRDHADPSVINGRNDLFYNQTFSQLANKPYILGELNAEEDSPNEAYRAPVQSMLVLATAAYGSLQNWSGVEWSVPMGGVAPLALNSQAKTEGPSTKAAGNVQNNMMIDHLRTAGILFREGLLTASVDPIVMKLGEPVPPRNYSDWMSPKMMCLPGWQDIHEIRNSFEPPSPDQSSMPWMAHEPSNPFISDTGQVIKDIDRKQLTVAAPAAEAFSGCLDGHPPAGLKHLHLSGTHFATVILIANDSNVFKYSHHLIISRTALDKSNHEIDGPVIRLTGLANPGPKDHWQFQITRPFGSAKDQTVEMTNPGELILPNSDWHECELNLK